MHCVTDFLPQGLLMDTLEKNGLRLLYYIEVFFIVSFVWKELLLLFRGR